MNYLLLHLHVGSHGLNPIAALDDIGLERDWPWSAVQLQKETAGIAENGARLIATPERGGARRTVLTLRLIVLAKARSSVKMMEVYDGYR